MSRSVRTILIVVASVILVLGISGGLVWWKLSGLKQQLLADLQKALGAQVKVASIDLDIWKGELRAAGITLTNERSSAPWQKGDISQATVNFKFIDIFAPSMPISVNVSSWNVVLHSPLRTAEAPPSTPVSDATPSDAASLSPPTSKGRIRVTHLSAQGGTVEMDFSDDRKITIHGVSFDSADNGAGVWNTQLQATSINAGSFTGGASAVEIRGDQDKLTFSNLHMQCEQGGVSGDGEVALGDPHDVKMDLKAVNVPITMLVAIQWQMKLSGLASGSLHYEGNDKGGSANGQIAVAHGKFNVLPWLGKVTVMVGLQDISDVEVDKATSNFAWKDGALQLSNLDLRKDGVTRIAGQVDIDPKGQVNGNLKLGLPSSVTSKWPQMQDKVFPVALEDYNWSEVHITGTADHLQEDLTPRLVSAGLGQGSDLLNSATQKATDLFHSILGK